MDLQDLFEGKRLTILKKANLIVSELNRKLSETDQPLVEVRGQLEEVLCMIDQVNNPDMFLEDYVDDTESFIVDMVVSLKSRGIDKFPLSTFEKELAENGYSIDQEFLVDFLADLDGVQEVIPGEDEIVFNTSVDRGVSDDEAAKEKAQIEKTATKVAKDNLKKDNSGSKLEI